MKRTCIIALLLSLVCMGAAAQSTLGDFRKGIEGRLVAFKADYAPVSGAGARGSFDVRFQEDAYHFTTSDDSGMALEVFCDSKSVWIVDKVSKECEVEPFSGSGEDLISSIYSIITGIEGLYKVKSSASGSFAGRKVTTVTLEYSGEGASIARSVRLHITPDLKLAGFEATDDNGFTTRFTVSGWQVQDRISPASYKFDEKALDKSWVVTDLR